MAAAMPPGPYLVPEDELTDLPNRMLAAEIVREQILRQTHQEVLNRREIGEPLTVIEIPVDPGISIEFRQEICGLTQPQIIKLAQAFLEVIKSEKDKAAQEEQ